MNIVRIDLADGEALGQSELTKFVARPSDNAGMPKPFGRAAR